MPRKKQPEDSTPSASDILDAWQKVVHEQLLNPDRIADWLRTATNTGKTPHDEPTKYATTPHAGHDELAKLKRHVARLERRIRKLESAMDGHAKQHDAKAGKPRRSVAKPAAKPRAKPSRTAKKPTKK